MKRLIAFFISVITVLSLAACSDNQVSDKKAAADGHDYTDDSEIWGKYVGLVKLVTGDPKNIKITYPGDLQKGVAL